MLPKPAYLGPGIHLVRRARKDYRCDSCGERLVGGEPYVRHALPPNSELGNRSWWILRSCGWTTGDCRRYWEIDAKDLRQEPHVIPT